jgi:hypothetical protein
MPQPNLIHPVPIEIEQLDTANTIFDDDYREPVMQSKRKVKKKILGQVKWWSSGNLDFSEGGVQKEYTGYVLFRKIDLDAQSITITSNDRVISINGAPYELYIINPVPAAFYPNLGPTLLKCYFSDRQPARL